MRCDQSENIFDIIISDIMSVFESKAIAIGLDGNIIVIIIVIIVVIIIIIIIIIQIKLNKVFSNCKNSSVLVCNGFPYFLTQFLPFLNISSVFSHVHYHHVSY